MIAHPFEINRLEGPLHNPKKHFVNVALSYIDNDVCSRTPLSAGEPGRIILRESWLSDQQENPRPSTVWLDCYMIEHTDIHYRKYIVYDLQTPVIRPSLFFRSTHKSIPARRNYILCQNQRSTTFDGLPCSMGKLFLLARVNWFTNEFIEVLGREGNLVGVLLKWW